MFLKLSFSLRWFLLVAIVALAGFLMLNASQQDSATMDELAHIPAGYSYLRYFDYRLNPEHPPLLKILAGAPLLFKNLNFPLQSAAWVVDVNGQWSAGAQFLYESGNNADEIVFLARFAPIFLTLILIILIYLWAKELIGRWWALLPAFLFAFSPTVLAHGHYVTTDVAAALGFFFALFSFLKFLFKPSKGNLFLAGLAFGVAQLFKFSAVLLIPYFIFLIIAFYLGRLGEKKLSFIRLFRSLIFIFIIGFALVYIFYFALSWNYPLEKQMRDADSLLTSFSPRWLPEITLWMTKSPILRPLGEYFLGLLMVLQRSAGGNTVYFLGEVSAAGWWYYFPLTFLLKEPIPSLLIVLAAVFIGFWNFIKDFAALIFRKSNKLLGYLTTHFHEFSMLVFIVLYLGYSMQSNLNIGVRHLLPILPFIYILSVGAIKRWFSLENALKFRNFIIRIFVLANELFGLSIKVAILSFLLIWYFVGAIIVSPHFLSYFSLAVGGTTFGYKYIVDSNYDWGQDLKRLVFWVKENLPAGEKIAIDYFGGGNPKYYLGNQAEYWRSAKGSPATEGIKWLAVSINTIQGAKGKLALGQKRNPEDEYQWLENPYQPYARAGTSIFIYRLVD